MGKWVIAVCLAGVLAGGAFADQAAPNDEIEYLLSVDPHVPGVAVISINNKTGAKTVLVSGASSIDEAIREAMLRTGKPLVLKFGGAS